MTTKQPDEHVREFLEELASFHNVGDFLWLGAVTDPRLPRRLRTSALAAQKAIDKFFSAVTALGYYQDES